MNNFLILEEKNYDLNSLLNLNFDTLKEVLIKLSKKVIDLDSEIAQLKNLDNDKNNKIIHLENKIDNLKEIITNNNKNEKAFNDLEENDLFNIFENNDNNKKTNVFNNTTPEKIRSNSLKKFDSKIINEEMQNTQIKSSLKKPKTAETNINKININFNKNKENIDKQKNKNKCDKILSLDKSDDNENNRKFSEYKITDNRISIDNESISSEKMANLILENPRIFYKYKTTKGNNVTEHTIYSINQQIRLINSKIKNIEKEILPTLKDDVNSLKSKTIPKIFDKFSSIEDDLKKKFSEIEENIERCNEQSRRFDLSNFLSVNNEGMNSDVSNIYYKLLDDKIKDNDKKYENKCKKLSEDNSQLFTNIINNKNDIEKLNAELISLQNQFKEINNQLNENQKKSINDLLTQNNNKINSEIKNQINLNNTKMESKIDEFLNELKEGLKSQNNSNNKNNNNENFTIDKTLLDFVRKKINELDNEVSNITYDLNGIKQYAKEKNKNFEEIKQTFNNIFKNLAEKIQLKDLNELYQLNSDNTGEIHYLKEKIKEINETLEKFSDDKVIISNRIEILTQDIENKKNDSNNNNNNYNKPEINLTNYIKEKQLKEALTPFNKEILKLKNEEDLINMRIEDINDKIKNLETKERINKLEENFTNQLSEISKKLKNKYLDKVDFNKIIKNIDIQLKLLSEKSESKDSDNWILAKKPLKCFNCASCEANVVADNPPKEFMPWNKYSGEKQYRIIGQGFSKLLQKINENKTYNDPKEQSFDYEIKNNNLNNNVNNVSNLGFKKENNENLINQKKNNVLPKLYKSRKKKVWESSSVQVSEDDKESGEDSLEFRPSSPKIIKITKIKNDKNDVLTEKVKKKTPHSKSIGLSTSMNKESVLIEKKSGKINRVNSVPLYN